MSDQPRKVLRIIQPQVVMDGAGVKIRRSIATRTLNYLDPFLLFDHFGSDNPDDYIAGFPMHPHRGIETVTYMLDGVVNHRDSIGNFGSIGAGDVQWMTAGGGIMHEEMPQTREGRLSGFQLWVNLPASQKMSMPRYQDVPSALIPEVTCTNGVRIRVITGTVDGVTGPVEELAVAPTYVDVSMPPKTSSSHPTPRGHTVFVYGFKGNGIFGGSEQDQGTQIGQTHLVQFDDGDFLNIHSLETPLRYLLIMGKPLNEPIARYGPFVMNTQEEIMQTLRDLENGTFVT